MKRLTIFGVALLSFVGVITSRGGPSPTDEYSRAGKWEAYGIGQYSKVTLVPVSSLEAGVGLGYNIIDQLNVNADVEGGSIGAGLADITVSSSIFSGHLSLDYNILKTRMTPFLNVGGGLYYLPVASASLYSFNLGAGVRWDINDLWFAKLAYQPTLAMHSGMGGIPVHVFSLSVGVKF